MDDILTYTVNPNVFRISYRLLRCSTTIQNILLNANLFHFFCKKLKYWENIISKQKEL